MTDRTTNAETADIVATSSAIEPLIRLLEASGRFHRHSRLGQIYHRGSVSYRELRRTDSLHVVTHGNRISMRIDRVSPLKCRPDGSVRYTLARIVAHNLAGIGGDRTSRRPRTPTRPGPGPAEIVKRLTHLPDRNVASRPLVGERGHVADSIARDTPWFARMSNTTRDMTGSPRFTAVLLALVVVWLAVGPVVGFSRAWELAATAGAPIVALILLAVLQHTQNRDDKAIHLKLNEMIRSSPASDGLISIEDSPEVELSRLLCDYRSHAGHGPPPSATADAATRRGRPGRRDRRRFANGDLGPDHSFIFRSPEGHLSLGAHNLQLFTLLAAGVDDDTWLDHLHRGDYSRWFNQVIGDNTLTQVASHLEGRDGDTAEDSRREIIKTIAQRYPLNA